MAIGLTSTSAIPTERASISGVLFLVLSLVLVSVLTLVNAFVLDLVIGYFQGLWLTVLTAIEIGGLLVVGVLKPEIRPTLHWDWQEILGMIVVGSVFFGHSAYLGPDDWMPVSFSVDCSHQHLLVNYIYQFFKFPEGVDYLYIYDDYPVGPSALVAFIARLTGLLPAQLMYPWAVLVLILHVIVIYGVIVEVIDLSGRFKYLAGLLATLGGFVVYPYSFRIFVENFYSNNMMGNLVILLALWMLIVRDRLALPLNVGIMVGLVAGCLFSYPAWLPFVVGPFVFALMLDKRLSLRTRLITVGGFLALVLTLTVVAVVDQWDFLTWFAPSRARRQIPSWRALGGGFLLLIALGLWYAVRNWNRYRPLLIFAAVDCLLVLAFYSLAILDKLTLYIPDKTFYFNAYIFLIFVGLAIAWLWQRMGVSLRIAPVVLSVSMALLGIASLWVVNSVIEKPDAYPITLDEYRVGYYVSQSLPDAEMTYLVRHPTVFYWLYGCVTNHTHDLVEQSERWSTSRPTYDRWISNASDPKFAIVSDVETLPADGKWTTRLRSGNAAVIERSP